MSKKLEKIYREIAKAVSAEDVEETKKAIVLFIKPYGFEKVETAESSDEIVKYELVDGADKIVARIESYDHSRTFELRPDSNHNYLELYEGAEKIDGLHYVFWDDM